MTRQTVLIVAPTGATVATAQVGDEGEHYGGTIDLAATPAAVRAVFEEFEDVVNGQMFVFLPDVERKISGLGLRARFEDGFESPVKDLQVFPSAGEVSFQLAAVPATS